MQSDTSAESKAASEREGAASQRHYEREQQRQAERGREFDSEGPPKNRPAPKR